MPMPLLPALTRTFAKSVNMKMCGSGGQVHYAPCLTPPGFDTLHQPVMPMLPAHAATHAYQDIRGEPK